MKDYIEERVLELAAYVLETGRIALQGTGAELLANDKVKELYLGKSGK